jgi:hypothetical protein
LVLVVYLLATLIITLSPTSTNTQIYVGALGCVCGAVLGSNVCLNLLFGALANSRSAKDRRVVTDIMLCVDRMPNAAISTTGSTSNHWHDIMTATSSPIPASETPHTTRYLKVESVQAATTAVLGYLQLVKKAIKEDDIKVCYRSAKDTYCITCTILCTDHFQFAAMVVGRVYASSGALAQFLVAGCTLMSLSLRLASTPLTK